MLNQLQRGDEPALLPCRRSGFLRRPYLGGERNGSKPGRGSENKVPIVAAVSLDEAGHPIHVKVAKVETFSFAAIADWAQDALARGCEVISDGLACFRAVAEVGCT